MLQLGLWKSESEIWKNQLRRSAGESRPMYLLLAGNDTVQILMQRGIDMRSTNECRLVLLVIWYGFDANSWN